MKINCRFALILLGLVTLPLPLPRAVSQIFSISVSPSALTTYPGTSLALTIHVGSDSYTGPVSVTLSGLPAGMTVSPASLDISPGNSGVLTLNTGLNAASDLFGAGGGTIAQFNAMMIGAVGATTVQQTVQMTVALAQNVTPASSQITLPVVRVTTANQAAILNNGIAVPGTVTVTNASGSKSYLPSSGNTDTTATFSVHGNSTATFPKLPYNIKLNTSIDLLNQMGLACPYVTSTSGKPTCDKSKTYILLANYMDKSLLRDWAASALANAIPYGGAYLDETPVPAGSTGVIPSPSGNAAHMPWAPHSLFVELYLNGTYQGNYQLIEKPNVDSHRVNVSELGESDTTDDVSGGYSLEIDARHQENTYFTTSRGLNIGIDDPDFSPDAAVSQQTTYISNYVTQAENALFADTYADPVSGWRAYFDEASAMNFYFVNDIMGNVDGGSFVASDYFYKAIDNPFLYMGPVWDFDYSSGNAGVTAIVNPTAPWMQTQASWYMRLFSDPGFKADAARQFNALRDNGVFTSWLASIRTQGTVLAQSAANNFQRWPILGQVVGGNVTTPGTYDGEVTYLTNFLTLRLAYFDSLFNTKAATQTQMFTSGTALATGNHVTLTANVTGNTLPTGMVFFLRGGVAFGSATLDGTGTARLVTTALPIGNDAIQAIYAGDTVNALSKSSVTVITVTAALQATVTSLAGPALPVPPMSPVTLSVSVTPLNRTFAPSGTVNFTSAGILLGSAVLDAAGTASFTTISLAAGVSNIFASYLGDTHSSGSSSVTRTVTVSDVGIPVTLTTIPAGLSLIVDGSAYTAPQTLSLAAGSTHTISATAPVGNFVSWSDGGSQTHSIQVPALATAYTASFSDAAYPLTLISSPAALGTITTPSAGGYFGAAGSVPLVATPSQGCAFQSWTGGVNDSSAASTSVLMSGPKTVVANFGPNLPGIQFGGPGGGGWCLQLNPGATDTASQLALSPNPGYYASSAFVTTPVPVTSFTNDFTFQMINAYASGMVWVLQNQGLSAVGPPAGLGFYGIQSSLGIKFDASSTSQVSQNSTGMFLYGAYPTVPLVDLTKTGVNLLQNHPIRAYMTYDGVTLTVLLIDTVTNARATQTYTVDIPTVVGAPTAFAGFTASSGGAGAAQNIQSWIFTPQTVLPLPVFSKSPGIYASGQQLSITDAAPGAIIYYTLDGSMPTSASTPYYGPITLNGTAMITAIAMLGTATTPTISGNFTALAAPVAFPAGGSYADVQTIVLSCSTPGATIFYTVDGSAPDVNAIRYVGPFTLNNTATLKAIAVLGQVSSATVSGTYSVLASPDISPAESTFYVTGTVTIAESTPGAAVYYTLDGTTPDASSMLYSAPLTLTATGTVQAVAILNGMATPVASTTYIVIPFLTSIDASTSFQTAGIALNGSAFLNREALRLTSGESEAGSAFSPVPLNVQSFSTDFTFQISQPVAEGMMFVIQGLASTALGGDGPGLGFSGMPQSVGVKFDIHDNSDGDNSTGLFLNGADPLTPFIDLTPSGVDLKSGDPMQVHMDYDGTTLTVTITDAVTGDTATQSYAVDIPAITGGPGAYVGFTAATSDSVTFHDVLSWTYKATKPVFPTWHRGRG